MPWPPASRQTLLLTMATTVVASSSSTRTAPDWSKATYVLQQAIANRTFPGCAAGVLAPNGSVILELYLGSQVYPGETAPLGGNSPTGSHSLWDMASLTKIMGATTVSAMLYESGLLDLRAKVADQSLLGPAYAANGKGDIEVADLLLHQAGYPPDPEPGYSTSAFGCPSATAPLPNLTFSCSERIFGSLLDQTLAYPPRSQWVYSDLSMVTMQYVLGTLIASHGLVAPHDLRPDCANADPADQRGLHLSCHFEAFVRMRAHAEAGLVSTMFLPPAASWRLAMPTYADPTWRKVAALQGDVSDENAYALGGIAGHAGIFTTLRDALVFLGTWAYGADAGYAPLVAPATRTLFMTAPDPSFSPRALGWLQQVATDPYHGCGAMAPSTAYHTGFTGTLLCYDLTSGIGLALLTTRVYPNASANTAAIQAVRQAFATAVAEALLPLQQLV